MPTLGKKKKAAVLMGDVDAKKVIQTMYSVSRIALLHPAFLVVFCFSGHAVKYYPKKLLCEVNSVEFRLLLLIVGSLDLDLQNTRAS